ncbi:MAG TPA: hypothetical protein VKU02_04670 [Gemmataceae bacterium]|nr:hypothetical protein [Gemmataceae bacterium]
MFQSLRKRMLGTFSRSGNERRRSYRSLGLSAWTYRPFIETLENRTLLDGTVFDVDVRAPWRDTGIDVVAGERLTLATDPSTTVSFGWADVNADGIGYGIGSEYNGTGKGGPNAVLPDAIFLSLIGKIGGTTDVGTGVPVPEAIPGKGPRKNNFAELIYPC